MFPETGIFRPVWLGLAWRVILLADYAPRFLHHYDAGLQIRSYRVIAFTAYLVNCGDSRDVYALLCFNNARKIRLRGGFTYKLIATPHRPRNGLVDLYSQVEFDLDSASVRRLYRVSDLRPGCCRGFRQRLRLTDACAQPMYK